MVVRESYSQLPHCPVPTQWRPSVATQHSTQIFSEESEKSVANTAFRNTERKPACLSHPWAFNTHIWAGFLLFWSSHHREQESISSVWVKWERHGKAKSLCGVVQGVITGRDKPLSCAQSPVPFTAWPPLTHTRTQPGTCLSSTLQMFTGVFTKHFKKMPVSEACLHILNLLSFQTFH